MKKSYIVLLLTAFALALFVPASIQAANNNQNNNNNNNNQPTPKKTPRVHTVIQSVDASSITIKEGEKTTTYKITPQTEITFKGNTATVADLKPGQRVEITAGMDPTTADRIVANDPPKDDKTK